MSEHRDVPLLQGKRVKLRDWVDADREAFAALNADPNVMRHFPATLTREESDRLADRIQDDLRREGFGLWAVEVPGEAPFIGFVGLSRPRFEAHFTPCVEVGWRLAHAHHGKGYASEGARLAVAFGFEACGLAEIVSFTPPENVASWRVMEKIGMTHDPSDDFDHPALPEGHRLRRHLLYRLDRAHWQSAAE